MKPKTANRIAVIVGMVLFSMYLAMQVDHMIIASTGECRGCIIVPLVEKLHDLRESKEIL